MYSLLFTLALSSNLIAVSPTHQPSSNPLSDKCPFCNLGVLKDTDSLNFRVVMDSKGKKVAYRCILCALADAKAADGDLMIETPSEKKDKPIKLIRKDGKWTVTPDTSVFAYAKGSHAECQTRYRALTSETALEAYRQTNPKVLTPAKALSLTEFMKVSE